MSVPTRANEIVRYETGNLTRTTQEVPCPLSQRSQELLRTLPSLLSVLLRSGERILGLLLRVLGGGRHQAPWRRRPHLAGKGVTEHRGWYGWAHFGAGFGGGEEVEDDSNDASSECSNFPGVGNLVTGKDPCLSGGNLILSPRTRLRKLLLFNSARHLTSRKFADF